MRLPIAAETLDCAATGRFDRGIVADWAKALPRADKTHASIPVKNQHFDIFLMVILVEPLGSITFYSDQ